MRWWGTGLCGALVALAVLSLPVYSIAETSATELQQMIDAQQAQIVALDKEIAQYQTQLDAVSTKKQTLQNTLSRLDLQLKKTTTSITSTKQKISTTQLQIQQLSGTIATKQASIDRELSGISESLRRIYEVDSVSFPALVLSASDMSEAWRDVNALNSLQDAMSQHIKKLAAEKQTLSNTKAATEEKKAQLLAQQKTLTTLQGSLNATKRAQSDLLVQTKSQESIFQSILAQKQAAKASFEDALSDLKAQFQGAVDASAITPAGKGILKWPTDKVRVSQYFGNTAFAQSGAYSGKGHNGIDIAVSIGTPIKAALSGIVIGTGNTDSVKGCYSFGRWVMVKHSNGLNTMYAHLSDIEVSEGQAVGTGQLLGYSGETGYATGPHLHFGVYVTSVTQIIKLGQATNAKTSCSNAVMPVAPLSGYLDPAKYLPAL